MLCDLGLSWDSQTRDKVTPGRKLRAEMVQGLEVGGVQRRGLGEGFQQWRVLGTVPGKMMGRAQTVTPQEDASPVKIPIDASRSGSTGGSPVLSQIFLSPSQGCGMGDQL